MKRLFAGLIAAMTLLSAGTPASAFAEGLQACHRVTLTKEDTTQENKSVIRVWTCDTALDRVDQELAAIEQAYVEDIGPSLPAAQSTKKNSRLDVAARYSRTGLTWMSFVIQARTTYHRGLTEQEFTTRTYDMTTGERILLTDIFAPDSKGWSVLENAVRDTVVAYFPNNVLDTDALEIACTRESLEQMDFSLHGMSLVLHLPADRFYPGHKTLIEVTLFYPQIRPYMTEKAQEETNNQQYYKTVSLTFDDGPTRTNTTSVLNSLLENGCVGTFFVVGNRIADFTDLVQREHDEGHAIGSHNWHHGTPSKSSNAALRAMPGKVNAAMIKAIGIPVRYDRVPYGLYNTMIKAGVKWPYIQWSLDTYDWRGRSTKTVLNTVKKQISDGDIILCHDIKDNTPASAAAICEYLMEEGYIFLTVDEMFAKDGVELKGGHVYYRCVDGVTSLK